MSSSGWQDQRAGRCQCCCADYTQHPDLVRSAGDWIVWISRYIYPGIYSGLWRRLSSCLPREGSSLVLKPGHCRAVACSSSSPVSTVSPDLPVCRRLSCARAPLLRDRLDLELIVQLTISSQAKELAHMPYASNLSNVYLLFTSMKC